MKTAVLAMFVLALSIASNAHALTAYNQTYTYSPPFSLNKGNDNQTTSFSFTEVTNQFLAGPESPSLSLNLTGSTDFKDVIVMVGTTYLATLTTEHPVIYFNGDLLNSLNSAIINRQITFNVEWKDRSSTLTSATMHGNLAPEPASALLVAAGLAWLPILRRFRKGRG